MILKVFSNLKGSIILITSRGTHFRI